ncbi:DUF1003 domain-containing protein [Bacillus sp. EB600]|uniref:DUF1003 domain-containing protein n=1 Tax=Bacillus sp. EB600 TaxID=2806345 RepID=UPI00210D642E|nr:DUF1003 domain-containing protein [Bacillus sp. EB600]MCQ6280384.1 DUF1003 domain-containing protein [Bacillus sp. EB600]
MKFNTVKKYGIKPEVKDEKINSIHGFDIELNKEDTLRIGRLVDNYEKSILAHLDDEYIRKTTWSDRLADRISSFGGSWKFIIFFSLFLVFWMIWNSFTFTKHFDSKPFILLNLILSFIAAFQAPVIMMSQNRQAARDKHESIIDFAINYKAEQEIDDLQSQLHQIKDELHSINQLLQANHKNEEHK